MQKIKALGRKGIGLILLCWLVYTSSYIGKVNYAANINEVMTFFQVDHSSAGLVSTFFFFSYGIGQIINGLLCKRYNVKWIVFISLIVSGTVNFVVGISSDFSLVKYLWLINGFSMSILWPSLIRLLSECLAENDMKDASIIMGTTVATGTLIVYALSALFVKISFKISFYLAAGVFGTVAFVWLFLFRRLVNEAKSGNEIEEHSPVMAQNDNKKDDYNKRILLLTIVVLGIFGVATNLIKDGLTTWVPSILKEQYNLDNSFSIILTLSLPVVAIFSNIFAVGLHKKFSDYVVECGLAFLCSGAIIIGVIGGTTLNQFWLTLVGFTLVCFLVSSCNSIITSIFPLFMKGKLNSGFIAGILNGCCYLGSTISSYGLGAIADNFGWPIVFWVLFFVCLGVCICTGIYVFVKKFLQKGKRMVCK